MNQKLFSVVVPTYNCGRKLAATIESVLAQPGDLYELIVVDGGSTDDTLKVAEEYGDSLKFVSEPDRGVYDALNKGVRLSSGMYLFFIGAGDCLRAGVLKRIAEGLPAGGPSFVYGGAYLARHSLLQRGPFRTTDFTFKNICHQAIFYERSVFDVVGGFDLKYEVYADWAFNMKCFADARVRKLYLDVVVADFEGWGISDTRVDLKFKKDLPRLIRKHLGLDVYVRHRIYRGRVAFHDFRRRLAASVRAGARMPASPLGNEESYEAEKETNQSR